MDMATLNAVLSEYRDAAETIGTCGDGNCVVLRLVGMHTNGGCRCCEDRRKAQRMMMAGNRLFRAVDAALGTSKNGEAE